MINGDHSAYLPLRATAIGFSASHGIIGRSDGLVYMWELTTGKRLQTLHHFKGTLFVARFVAQILVVIVWLFG